MQPSTTVNSCSPGQEFKPYDGANLKCTKNVLNHRPSSSLFPYVFEIN